MNVQNLRPICCYGVTVTDKATAKETLKLIVKYLGTGFNPNTPAREYVSCIDKSPVFVFSEADYYDENLALIFKYLDDVYAEAIELWHEFGMIDNKQYETLTLRRGIMTQANLLKIVNEIVWSFLEEDDKYCCAVDIDVSTGDTVGVRWMEFDGFPTVIAANKRLSDELYKRTGRHFCLSHNSPTDGHVLIFVDKHMDTEYDPDHFKKSFIAQFEAWQNEGVRYDGPHSKAIIFQTLDDTIGRDCECDWRDAIKPNFEMWHQVMTFARNGISL
jgi:hypothetical protein